MILPIAVAIYLMGRPKLAIPIAQSSYYTVCSTYHVHDSKTKPASFVSGDTAKRGLPCPRITSSPGIQIPGTGNKQPRALLTRLQDRYSRAVDIPGSRRRFFDASRAVFVVVEMDSLPDQRQVCLSILRHQTWVNIKQEWCAV